MVLCFRGSLYLLYFFLGFYFFHQFISHSGGEASVIAGVLYFGSFVFANAVYALCLWGFYKEEISANKVKYFCAIYLSLFLFLFLPRTVHMYVAEKNYADSLKIFPFNEAEVLRRGNSLGELYSWRGKHNEAIAIYSEMLQKLKDEYGDEVSTNYSSVLYRLVKVYCDIKQYDKALIFLNGLGKKFKSVNSGRIITPSDSALLKIETAKVLIKIKDYSTAEANLLEAEKILSRQEKINGWNYTLYSLFLDLYERIGEKRKYQEYQIKMNRISR